MPSFVRPLSSAAPTQMLVFNYSNDTCWVACDAAKDVAYNSADDAVSEAASVIEASSSVPSLRRSL